MKSKTLVLCASITMLAVAVACSDKSTPVSPSPSAGGGSEAGPDGSTLKATAPAPQSPVNGQQPDQLVLSSAKSTATFSTSTPLSYEFEIKNAGGTTVCSSGVVGAGAGSSVAWQPTNCTLQFDQPYTWRIRAALNNARGPWSSAASFRAPKGGYIRAQEIMDPLTNSETVGQIRGAVTFLGQQGVRLENFDSHIAYVLPQTLIQGEFSILITGMATNTEGGKTKVMAMGEGFDDIVTNERRMTVEKRGDPEGVVAWRFISHEDQIDTEGAEREFVPFDANQTYMFKATWRNQFFNVEIKRGGPDGVTIYSKGKPYQGLYDPNPHVVYIGAPVGRSGPDGATVPGMIVRNVPVSRRNFVVFSIYRLDLPEGFGDAEGFPACVIGIAGQFIRAKVCG